MPRKPGPLARGAPSDQVERHQDKTSPPRVVQGSGQAGRLHALEERLSKTVARLAKKISPYPGQD